jgi:hypothetical protein
VLVRLRKALKRLGWFGMKHTQNWRFCPLRQGSRFFAARIGQTVLTKVQKRRKTGTLSFEITGRQTQRVGYLAVTAIS